MMAAVTWFPILAYSWHVSFRKLETGSVEDKLHGKIAYFHIGAWALPLVCAIIAMALKKVCLLEMLNFSLYMTWAIFWGLLSLCFVVLHGCEVYCCSCATLLLHHTLPWMFAVLLMCFCRWMETPWVGYVLWATKTNMPEGSWYCFLLHSLCV